MLKKTMALVMFLAFSLIYSCDEGGKSPSTDNTANNLDTLTLVSLSKLQNCTGTAEGSSYTGVYKIGTGTATFSGNCPADVIKKVDFFVDMSLSEEKIAEIINNGYPQEESISLIVEQTDGKIVFKGVGDDGVNMSGCINNDGNFNLIHSYGFEGENNYWVSSYEGSINNLGGIQGNFESRLKALPTVNCLFKFMFAGTLNKVVSTYSCISESDCVHTYFKNVPTSVEECKCSHMCYGEVVNISEGEARDSAYNKFCGGVVEKLSCPVASCLQYCGKTICENGFCSEEEIECSY